MKRHNTPTIISIFGVTGDLAQKKIFPALIDLYEKNLLPERFSIVGIARRDLSREEFVDFVKKAVSAKKTYSEDILHAFLGRIQYSQGQFDDVSTYENTKKLLQSIDEEWGQCSNKLFYLSVPPVLYKGIATKLADSGLSEPCSDSEGWSRILIEKPFGNDVETAQELDMLLGKLFKEEQIYRIDHYLEKQTLQNIMAFRFSNSIFEPLWNRDHIEKIDIHLFENNTAEGRGGFYDANGALRDVGQNHLLQMLALVAMEQPASLHCPLVRRARADVFKKLRMPKVGDVARGQYEGYQNIDGVAVDSETETFFSVTAFIQSKKWKGVPFHLSSGKALQKSQVEIVIHFKDETPGSFMPEQHERQEANKITISIQPDEKISILFWVKLPGFEEKMEPKELSFSFHDHSSEHIDAYEKVLFDCISGDQTSFVTTDEVLQTWKYIMAVRDTITTTPLHTYAQGLTGYEVLELLGKKEKE